MDGKAKDAGEGHSVDPGNQSQNKHSGPPEDCKLICSNGGDSIQVEDAMEAEENQDFDNQDRICDEQEQQTVPQDLERATSKDCFKYAQQLMEMCNNQTPIKPNEFLKFCSLVVKSVSHSETQQTSDKERSFSSMSLYRPRVRVFSVVTGQTFGADITILEQVKNVRFSAKVEMTKDLQECDIILIFCPIMSRIGSDVEAAMKNMSVSSGKKPAILVLMHHTRDIDYSTGGRNWSENYPDVKLEVHVLFHETRPGLLKCQQNTQAVEEIQKQLYDYSKWRWAQ